MNRRSLLKGALGTLSAAVGAFALGKGVDARETVPEGVQGQRVDATVSALPFSGGNWPAGTSWGYDPAAPSFLYEGVEDGLTAGEMTLVAGPGPDTMVHTIFHPDGTASVLPSWDALPPDAMHHMMAIPRASFAEFDPAYGMVTLTDLKPTNEGKEIGEIAIRIAYLREIYRRYPALAQNSDREREARLEEYREWAPASLLR